MSSGFYRRKRPGDIVTHVSFSRPATTTPAATQISVSERSPVTGTVQYITVHFPGGCNALVELSCFINGKQILPVSGFIALDDAIQDFPVSTETKKYDRLVVLITNRDAATVLIQTASGEVEKEYVMKPKKGTIPNKPD